MKNVLIFFLFFLYTASSFASPDPYYDSLVIELHQVISQATVYDNDKSAEITRLKKLLRESQPEDIDKQYDTHLRLYEAYKYYNYDSALAYAKKLLGLAYKKHDVSLITDSKLKGVFIMLSGGMFKETFDSLSVINLQSVSDSIKADYYTLVALAYYNLADYTNDDQHSPGYKINAALYLDSALALYPVRSFEHLYYSALKFIKNNNYDSAILNLKSLISRKDLSYHEIALATSSIGGMLISQGHDDQAKAYLIEASIADVKSSTKETLALLNLAGIIYKEGNVEDALLYIQKANADAIFYNARLRKVQVGTILPLIEDQMIHTVKTQKEKLSFLLIIVSILVVLLAGFTFIIRNQVKKLKITRANLYASILKEQQINQEYLKANELKERYNAALQEINRQLVEANEIKEKFNIQLQQTNLQLIEANKFKEEYIGNYFKNESVFLTRMEKLFNSLDKKLVERNWESIKFILKSVDLKAEKEDILKNFDKVFLRLFPNFVSQFNTLFKPEDQVVLKDDQLLNTELRIIALIRMGITENEKIAEILGYSINTIYSYKTKLRLKTIVPKDDFEKRVFEITTIGS